jgi:RNAse (barnase) inhibitor barstar
MREIIMDGKGWNASDDVYNAFFEAVGAPSWHGHNFDALRDSIVVGRINRIEIPYIIKIKNYNSIRDGAKSMAAEFVHLIKEFQESGYPVDIQIEN